MSEVYKFAAMSEVETMEAPTGTTTLLAVEGGTVKQIPASGFAAGGSAGSFVVRGTMNVSDYSVTADKTHGEIMAAVEAGHVPVFVLPMAGSTMFLPLLIIDEAAVMRFALILPTAQMEVNCTPENVWSFIMGD